MRLIFLPHAGTVVLWQLSQRLLLSRQIWTQEKSGNNWTDCIISELLSTAELSTHPLRTFRSWPWYLQAEKDTPVLWYWKTSVGCGRSKADPPAKPSSEAHPLTLPSLSMQPCPILAEGHQCIPAGLVVLLLAESKDGRMKTQLGTRKHNYWDYCRIWWLLHYVWSLN